MYSIHTKFHPMAYRFNAGEGTNNWRTITNCTAQSVSIADCSSSRRVVECPDSERIAIICTECKYHQYGVHHNNQLLYI